MRRAMSDEGMGLAQWKTEESYLDLKFIVGVVDTPIFTALTNLNLEDCQDQNCDGKLVSVILQSEAPLCD